RAAARVRDHGDANRDAGAHREPARVERNADDAAPVEGVPWAAAAEGAGRVERVGAEPEAPAVIARSADRDRRVDTAAAHHAVAERRARAVRLVLPGAPVRDRPEARKAPEGVGPKRQVRREIPWRPGTRAWGRVGGLLRRRDRFRH